MARHRRQNEFDEMKPRLANLVASLRGGVRRGVLEIEPNETLRAHTRNISPRTRSTSIFGFGKCRKPSRTIHFSQIATVPYCSSTHRKMRTARCRNAPSMKRNTIPRKSGEQWIAVGVSRLTQNPAAGYRGKNKMVFKNNMVIKKCVSCCFKFYEIHEFQIVDARFDVEFYQRIYPCFPVNDLIWPRIL